MRDWYETTIGAQVTLQRGVDLSPTERRDGPYPVISSGGVFAFHDRPGASGPGVLLGRKGTIGTVHYSVGDYWPYSTCLWVKDFHGNDPRFVYYFFRSIARVLAGMDVGSANPTLNRNHVHPMPVRWPGSHIEQRAIASLLGALDDKIESNGRLAYLARESAKLLLQAAGSDADGLKVGEIADVRKGLSYKGGGLASEGIPMVNMGSAAPYGWLKREGFKHYTGEYKRRHFVKGGSLLIVNTEQTWRQEIIGWPLILPIDMPEALFTHHIFVVDFKPEWEWARWALWAHLFTPPAREFIDGRVYGTTVATLPASAISEIYFPVPRVGSGASKSADALLKRSWAAEVESSTIAAIRDALLPGLLSGRIRVPEAQVLLEAAV